jgi:hypothetical protein
MYSTSKPATLVSRLLFLGIANTIYKLQNYSILSIDPLYNVAALDLESFSISC